MLLYLWIKIRLVGDSLLDYQSAYIKAKKPSTVYVFGGTGAVSDAIASDAVKNIYFKKSMLVRNIGTAVTANLVALLSLNTAAQLLLEKEWAHFMIAVHYHIVP